MAAKKNKYVEKTKKQVRLYLDSRTHRSFHRTKRRDYARELKLPGYVKFTTYVSKTMWSNRKTFVLLGAVYVLVTLLLVGLASQDLYSTMSSTLTQTSGDLFGGGFGQVGKAGLLFLTTATGGISQNLTEAQQIYAGLILILTWMTTVWLLRNIMAGHKVKVRDGLYNAGAPIVSTFVVAVVFIVQLLPLGLALIAYSAASATGLLNGGVEAMLFWIAFGLLALLSLYWITSTFFALVMVTLPGMYPIRAIKTANDLILGRRVRVLLRLVWMATIVILAWIVIMIPVIMVDMWIKDAWDAISWFPTIPILLLVLSTITAIWVSSYVYLLYRKVVDDESN
jgi:hypothetical protein